MNNIGYLFTKLELLPEAENCLTRARQIEGKGLKGLIQYNLAMLALKKGDCEGARKVLAETSDVVDKHPDEGDVVRCLLVPVRREDGTVELKERWDPRLSDAIKEAERVLESKPGI